MLRTQQGDGGAREPFEQALAIYREIGDRRGEAGVLSGIATIVSDDTPAEGGRALRRGAGDRPRIGDKRRIAVELNNLGVTWEQQRKLAAAGKNYQEAARVFHEAGFDSAAGSALGNLASTLLNRGELDSARDTAQEALQILRPTDSQPDIGWATTVLGQVLIAADELEPARRRLEQASAILEKLGQGGDVAGNDVLLVTVAFDERRFADAMTLGRAAAAKAEAAQSKLNEAAAWAVVASGAAGAHQTKPAADALARAEALQPKSGVDPDDALTLTLAKARVQAAPATATPRWRRYAPRSPLRAATATSCISSSCASRSPSSASRITPPSPPKHAAAASCTSPAAPA